MSFCITFCKLPGIGDIFIEYQGFIKGPRMRAILGIIAWLPNGIKKSSVVFQIKYGALQVLN